MKCVHKIFNYMGYSTFSQHAVQHCFFISDTFVKNINQNKIIRLRIIANLPT